MPNDTSDGGRRPSFSQRHGYMDFSSAMQVESLDDRARVDLWNLIVYPKYLDQPYPDRTGMIIWCNHLGLPRHAYRYGDLADRLNTLVFTGGWYEVYDLIEFFASHTSEFKRDEFNADVNRVLKMNRVGYRVVDTVVVPVTSEHEMDAIVSAAETPLINAAEHIRKAIALFAVRDNPNYAKAIQEAMSGAEA